VSDPPELGIRADYDSAQAGETRRRVLGRFCDTSTLLYTCTSRLRPPADCPLGRWVQNHPGLSPPHGGASPSPTTLRLKSNAEGEAVTPH